MGKAKIIYTLGPSTDKKGALEQLIQGGMDVARCGFSHSSYVEDGRRMHEIKQLQKENRPIDILMDIKESEDQEGQCEADVLFGIHQNVDFLTVSFMRTKEDIWNIRRLLNENGGSKIQLIAKVEDDREMDNIDSILEAADGIMLAKGAVPLLQKVLMKKVYEAGKMYITETQMLDFKAG